MAKISSKNQKTAMKEKDQAKNILARVPQEKEFRCIDGQTFADLMGLSEGFSRMSDATFMYHCNEAKNDFYNWVAEVIGDKELAQDLKPVKNCQQAQGVVKQRYGDLTRLEG